MLKTLPVIRFQASRETLAPSSQQPQPSKSDSSTMPADPNQTSQQPPKLKVQRIGLTAGPGCGKSTVLKELQALGVPVTDADAIVHELLNNDPVVRQNIFNEFGADVFATPGGKPNRSGPDGPVDRNKLGKIAFANPPKLKLLESWLHPKVRTAVREFFEKHDNVPKAVAEIPLLFESKLEHMFDKIWVVFATEQQQIDRQVGRKPGFTEADAKKRIASQMPLAEKVKKAHVVLDNSGTLDNLKQQIKREIQKP